MCEVPTYDISDLRRRRFEIIDSYQRRIVLHCHEPAKVSNLLAQQDADLAALGRLYVKRTFSV